MIHFDSLYHFAREKMNKIIHFVPPLPFYQRQNEQNKKMIHFDPSVTSMSTINIP